MNLLLLCTVLSNCDKIEKAAMAAFIGTSITIALYFFQDDIDILIIRILKKFNLD
jgi:hypothetical protein